MCDNQINPLVPQAAGSCTTACPGNPQEKCGGTNAINVYQINRQDSTIQPNINSLTNLINSGGFTGACVSGVSSCSKTTFGSWTGHNQALTVISNMVFQLHVSGTSDYGLFLNSQYRVKQTVSIITGNWYLFSLDLRSFSTGAKTGLVTLTHGSTVESILLSLPGVRNPIIAGKKFKATGTF